MVTTFHWLGRQPFYRRSALKNCLLLNLSVAHMSYTEFCLQRSLSTCPVAFQQTFYVFPFNCLIL